MDLLCDLAQFTLLLWAHVFSPVKWNHLGTTHKTVVRIQGDLVWEGLLPMQGRSLVMHICEMLGVSACVGMRGTRVAWTTTFPLNAPHPPSAGPQLINPPGTPFSCPFSCFLGCSATCWLEVMHPEPTTCTEGRE